MTRFALSHLENLNFRSSTPFDGTVFIFALKNLSCPSLVYRPLEEKVGSPGESDLYEL